VGAAAKKWSEWKVLGKAAMRSNGVRDRRQGRGAMRLEAPCAGRAEKRAASASDAGRTIDANVLSTSRRRGEGGGPTLVLEICLLFVCLYCALRGGGIDVVGKLL